MTGPGDESGKNPDVPDGALGQHPRHPRGGIAVNEWTDQKTSHVAAYVIAGAGLTILALVACVVAYSGVWGYALRF